MTLHGPGGAQGPGCLRQRRPLAEPRPARCLRGRLARQPGALPVAPVLAVPAQPFGGLRPLATALASFANRGDRFYDKSLTKELSAPESLQEKRQRVEGNVEKDACLARLSSALQRTHEILMHQSGRDQHGRCFRALCPMGRGAAPRPGPAAVVAGRELSFLPGKQLVRGAAGRQGEIL